MTNMDCQARKPIERRCERSFGEVLESILRTNPSQPSSDPIEAVMLTPSSLSDPLPMQRSIEESDYNDSSDTEVTSVDEGFLSKPFVPSYDKTCVWCEWEKTEATEHTGTPCQTHHNEGLLEPLVPICDKICIWCEWEKVEAKEHEGTRCPSHHNESTRANFNENTRELSPPNIKTGEVLEFRGISLHDMSSSDRPGRCLPQELPPLLFRWWNKRSHGLNTRTLLIAAAFAKAESSVEHAVLEDMGREEFLKAFKNHVIRAPIDSPFISTFKSPLSPIHRAVRHQDGAVISVIDPSKLETNVFKAAPLAEMTNTTLKKWKGFGEYEVWEKIEGSAIVCTFDIDTLMLIDRVYSVIGGFLQLPVLHGYEKCSTALHVRLKSILKSHHNHDMALSQLMELLEVPEQYRAAICQSFKESWLEHAVVFETRETSRSVSPWNGVYVHPMDMPVFPYPFPFTPPPRYRRSVSENSYKPPRRDEDTEGESSEEEVGSQSPAARCPRHDTPSSGFSVQDDSDESDDEDAYRRFNAKQFRAHPAIPINFAGRDEIEKTPDVSDMETIHEWPSEGEHYRV